MQRLKIICTVAVASILNSCVGYPRLLNYPFVPGDLGLNTPAAELTPQITQRYIVFSSDRRGRQNIYLYDTLNRKLIDLPRLNSLDTIATEPAISANSRYIVFAATRQGRSNIILYDRETNQLRNLTANLQSDVRKPTISSDGSTIAFESSANGQWDILVYNKYGNPLNIPLRPR
ncbi:MAG: Tol biopolymer transporter periplasmic protein [Microcoleaceae cyanobacterium]